MYASYQRVFIYTLPTNISCFREDNLGSTHAALDVQIKGCCLNSMICTSPPPYQKHPLWCFGGPFLTLTFPKRLFVTPELVTQGKKSSMTIKETDFPIMLKPECIRFVHTYWTIESTMDTPASKFTICQIIMD
jgi:hypothetical protein